MGHWRRCCPTIGEPPTYVARLNPQEILDHVFSNVVSIPITSALYQSLITQGIDTMPDLLTFDLPAFLTATARPAYTLGETNRLSVLLAFNIANVTHNGGYTVDYERVTRDMFTCYQGTYYTPGAPTAMPSMNRGYHPHGPSGGFGPTGHHRHPQTIIGTHRLQPRSG
jgi:hypothetical protein